MHTLTLFLLIFADGMTRLSRESAGKACFRINQLICSSKQPSDNRKLFYPIMFKIKGRARRLRDKSKENIVSHEKFSKKSRELSFLRNVVGPSERENQLDASISRLKDEITTMAMEETITEESKDIFTQLSYESEKMNEDIKSMSSDVIEKLKQAIKTIECIPEMLANL